MVLWAGHEARTGKGMRSRRSSSLSVNMFHKWKCRYGVFSCGVHCHCWPVRCLSEGLANILRARAQSFYKFACLWEFWRGKQGLEDSYTIININYCIINL